MKYTEEKNNKETSYGPKRTMLYRAIESKYSPVGDPELYFHHQVWFALPVRPPCGKGFSEKKNIPNVDDNAHRTHGSLLPMPLDNGDARTDDNTTNIPYT